MVLNLRYGVSFVSHKYFYSITPRILQKQPYPTYLNENYHIPSLLPMLYQIDFQPRSQLLLYLATHRYLYREDRKLSRPDF